MKLKERYGKFLAYISNTERDIQERMFMITCAFALIALAVATIVGVIIGESAESALFTTGAFVVFTIIVSLSIRYKRIKAGASVISFLLITVVTPMLFLTSGAIYGGTPIWVVCLTLFISLVLSGKTRNILLFLDFLVVTACYFYTYTNPESYVEHTRDVAFSDSYYSIIIVAVLLTILIIFEIKLFRNEAERYMQQRNEIEELGHAQNRFFSAMSHEIRTPINTIIGLNEMILRENISDEVAEDAENIQSASRMLLSLINDILDMSKFQSGDMSLTEVNYHPDDMLSEIVGMMWIRAKEKKLDFKVDVAPDIPSELVGDEVRIKQILINIINNAIKYTSEGSVSVSIQCDKKSNDEANMIYSVTDTGMGIKKENIPHLFDAFKRLDEEKNRYIEGTGLGLSIVKQLVDLMKGKITVNSVYTKGSTFIIEIPQRVADNKGIGEFNMEDSHHTRDKAEYRGTFIAPEAKILVVDDNNANLLVISKLLRNTKVNIDTASNGTEALEKCMDEKYDAIFMDHLMPGIDGIECFKRIRNQIGGLNKTTKVVALTANAGSENKLLYEKEGFDGYLSKPVNGRQLEKELRNLLPDDMVTVIEEDTGIVEESMLWLNASKKKAMVLITTESVADLPRELMRKYNIAVIPHKLVTDKGTFKDVTDIDGDAIIQYFEKGGKVLKQEPPDVEEYETFFAEQLLKANNIIHISTMSRAIHGGYIAAREAATAFNNVTVIDSGQISAGMATIAVEAARMAEEGRSVSDINNQLVEKVKNYTSHFVVTDLSYIARNVKSDKRALGLMNAFMFRPILKMKDGRITTRRAIFGTRERAWKQYLKYALKQRNIDNSFVIVSYSGMKEKDIERLRDEIMRRGAFGDVYITKGSAVVVSNVGPGAFGIFCPEIQ